MQDRAGLGRPVRLLDLDGQRVWYGVGGLEVATTVERMQELKRRQGFARSYGLEGTELLSRRSRRVFAALDPSSILGAYWVPSDGAGKGVKIVEALARKAQVAGVGFEGGVTVTEFDIREGRVSGVQTDRGTVECERVLLCAGIWGPSVGALAGVPIPLVAVQHQLVWTDPIPELAGMDGDTWARQPVPATRTCRCTSASAMITSASGTTATSRSSRRNATSVDPASRCSRR